MFVCAGMAKYVNFRALNAVFAPAVIPDNITIDHPTQKISGSDVCRDQSNCHEKHAT